MFKVNKNTIAYNIQTYGTLIGPYIFSYFLLNAEIYELLLVDYRIQLNYFMPLVSF